MSVGASEGTEPSASSRKRRKTESTSDYDNVESPGLFIENDGTPYFLLTKKGYLYRVSLGLVSATSLDLIIAFFKDGKFEDKAKYAAAKFINEISAELGLGDDKTVQVPNPPSPRESKGKPHI